MQEAKRALQSTAGLLELGSPQTRDALFGESTTPHASYINSFIQRQTMMFTKFQKHRASTSWRLWCAQQKQFTPYYIDMTDDDKKEAHVK